METQTTTLSQRLREETRDAHKHAEERPLERALIGGTLPRAIYTEYLAQRLLIHQALERTLNGLAERDERIGAIFLDDQQQAHHIEADLLFLGVDGSRRQPLPMTMLLVGEIETLGRSNNPALLGMLYVFEGAKNGARFVANSLRLAYKLVDSKGLQYLNPHGARQRAVWEDFKKRCDAAVFTPEESNAIIAAAKLVFAHLASVDDEVIAGDNPVV